MKNYIPGSVAITTAMFIFFIFVCGFDDSADFIMILFTALHLMIIWMVYSVLRFNYVSPYTYRERFYEDVDNKRFQDEDNQISEVGDFMKQENSALKI